MSVDTKVMLLWINVSRNVPQNLEVESSLLSELEKCPGTEAVTRCSQERRSSCSHFFQVPSFIILKSAYELHEALYFTYKRLLFYDHWD